MLVKMKDVSGNVMVINPDHVIRLSINHSFHDPVVSVMSIHDTMINVPGTIDEVFDKLNGVTAGMSSRRLAEQCEQFSHDEIARIDGTPTLVDRIKKLEAKVPELSTIERVIVIDKIVCEHGHKIAELEESLRGVLPSVRKDIARLTSRVEWPATVTERIVERESKLNVDEVANAVASKLRVKSIREKQQKIDVRAVANSLKMARKVEDFRSWAQHAPLNIVKRVASKLGLRQNVGRGGMIESIRKLVYGESGVRT